MPLRRSRGHDLRAIDAFKRIHTAVSETAVPEVAAQETAVPDLAPAPRREAPRRAAPRREAPRRAGAAGIPHLERPRPPGPVLIATAVVAGLALVTLAVARLGHFGSSTPAHRASNQSAASGSAANPSSAPAHTVAPAPAPPTTTPARYTPTSTTSGSASYVVGTPGFSVDVATTTGPCWVEVGPGPAGPFSFASTIPLGSHQSFPAVAGALWIRLGAPSAAVVSVNGIPVQFPPPASTPYDLSFSAS